MSRLKNLEEYLLPIMEEEEETRDNYLLLYALYLGLKMKLTDEEYLSLISVSTKIKNADIPSVESVGRCARKIKEKYPQLRTTKKEEEKRKLEKIQEFREYSKEE